MHKKGSLLSIWWILCLAVISVGIVAAVISYSGTNIDLRGVESNLLTSKVINCLSEDGLVSKMLEDKFNLADYCALNKVANSADGDYLVAVRILDKEGKNMIKSGIDVGNIALKKACSISMSKGTIAKRYPVCVEENASIQYYKNGEIKQGILNVLVGSTQEAGRTPI